MLTSAYRSCAHEKTGYTPNLLMFGREINLPIELALGTVAEPQTNIKESQYVSELTDKLKSIYQLVRKSFKMNFSKKDCDPRISAKTYKVGDLVYYRDSTRTVGKSPKLKAEIWKGPCVIVKKLSDLLFELQKTAQSKSKILHFDRLKSYTSERVPEMTSKLKENMDLNNKDVPTVSQQRDDPSKGVNISKPKNSSLGVMSDNWSRKQTLRRSQRQRQKPDRFMMC